MLDQKTRVSSAKTEAVAKRFAAASLARRVVLLSLLATADHMCAADDRFWDVKVATSGIAVVIRCS